MLPIKRESYFYDVYPRVVLTERETKITIRPIDAHAAFSPDAVYTIRVIPLTADIYSRSKPAFYETQVSPKNGAIEFYWVDTFMYIDLGDIVDILCGTLL